MRNEEGFDEIEDLQYDLVLCWITAPSDFLQAPTAGPFNIDKSGHSSLNPLTIHMNAFSVTNEPECANLVFEISMSHSNDASFDPISDGYATYVDNEMLIFDDF